MGENMATSSQGVTEQVRAWNIDPAHTQVEFGVRHLMLSTVKGRFPGVAGTVRLDQDDPSRSSVKVEIDASSIDTRNADRDAHLRSGDFFDVENHPTIRFESREVEISDDRYRVGGELTIRGVSRPVVLRVERLGEVVDPWGNERIGFHAETRINRKDFGLTWNQLLEAGGVTVGEEVQISLDIQAVAGEEA